LPLTIANALGCLSVKGLSLEPRPAASIIALPPSPKGEKSLECIVEADFKNLWFLLCFALYDVTQLLR